MLKAKCLLLIITINKGVINMNNFKKIGLSALAGSLAAFSANAGEMTVSGGANIYMTATNELNKTTYSMDDHVTFSGSGELDNGMTVTYSLQLDGDEADDGVVDNHSIKIDTNGSGTITYGGHGTDTVMAGWDDKTPNAYEEATDGLTTSNSNQIINGVGGNDVVRYDSESYGGATFHASMMMVSADIQCPVLYNPNNCISNSCFCPLMYDKHLINNCPGTEESWGRPVTSLISPPLINKQCGVGFHY